MTPSRLLTTKEVAQRIADPDAIKALGPDGVWIPWWLNMLGPYGRMLDGLRDLGLLSWVGANVECQASHYRRTEAGRAAWLEAIGVTEVVQP